MESHFALIKHLTVLKKKIQAFQFYERMALSLMQTVEVKHILVKNKLEYFSEAM